MLPFAPILGFVFLVIAPIGVLAHKWSRLLENERSFSFQMGDLYGAVLALSLGSAVCVKASKTLDAETTIGLAVLMGLGQVFGMLFGILTQLNSPEPKGGWWTRIAHTFAFAWVGAIAEVMLGAVLLLMLQPVMWQK